MSCWLLLLTYNLIFYLKNWSRQKLLLAGMKGGKEENRMENLTVKNVEYEAQAKSNESQWWFLKENIVKTETEVLSKMN